MKMENKYKKYIDLLVEKIDIVKKCTQYNNNISNPDCSHCEIYKIKQNIYKNKNLNEKFGYGLVHYGWKPKFSTEFICYEGLIKFENEKRTTIIDINKLMVLKNLKKL